MPIELVRAHPLPGELPALSVSDFDTVERMNRIRLNMLTRYAATGTMYATEEEAEWLLERVDQLLELERIPDDVEAACPKCDHEFVVAVR